MSKEGPSHLHSSMLVAECDIREVTHTLLVLKEGVIGKGARYTVPYPLCPVFSEKGWRLDLVCILSEVSTAP
jgi:hypothetical protein